MKIDDNYVKIVRYSFRCTPFHSFRLFSIRIILFSPKGIFHYSHHFISSSRSFFPSKWESSSLVFSFLSCIHGFIPISAFPFPSYLFLFPPYLLALQFQLFFRILSICFRYVYILQFQCILFFFWVNNPLLQRIYIK